MLKQNKDSLFNPADASAHEAFVQVNSGDGNPDDFNNLLNDWQSRDPGRKSDYQDLEGLWQELGVYTADLPAELLQSYRPAGTVKRARRRWAVSAIAASALLLAATLFLLPFTKTESIQYSTGRGEQLTINLADGSTVLLNSLTRMEVAFDDDSRSIELLQGEALFNVAHDSKRKFIVGTRHGAIQAVGTAFNINTVAENVMVTVLDGTVMISPATSADNAELKPAFAGKGRHIQLGKGVLENAAVNMEQVMAWTERKLIFSGEPLAQGLKRVNLHSKRNLIVEDERLKNLPLYGVFNMGDSAGFIHALEQALPIKPVDISKETTLLLYKEK